MDFLLLLGSRQLNAQISMKFHFTAKLSNFYYLQFQLVFQTNGNFLCKSKINAVKEIRVCAERVSKCCLLVLTHNTYDGINVFSVINDGLVLTKFFSSSSMEVSTVSTAAKKVLPLIRTYT